MNITYSVIISSYQDRTQTKVFLYFMKLFGWKLFVCGPNLFLIFCTHNLHPHPCCATSPKAWPAYQLSFPAEMEKCADAADASVLSFTLFPSLISCPRYQGASQSMPHYQVQKRQKNNQKIQKKTKCPPAWPAYQTLAIISCPRYQGASQSMAHYQEKKKIPKKNPKEDQ